MFKSLLELAVAIALFTVEAVLIVGVLALLWATFGWMMQW